MKQIYIRVGKQLFLYNHKSPLQTLSIKNPQPVASMYNELANVHFNYLSTVIFMTLIK